MFKRLSLLILAFAVTACAHRGAVRVVCEGPLRPINRPAPAPQPAAAEPSGAVVATGEGKP
jgi:hypothetical protein